MNEIRVIRCGDTVFAIGKLFDPNDLVDLRTIRKPVEMIAHQFDWLGELTPANVQIMEPADGQQANVEP